MGRARDVSKRERGGWAGRRTDAQDSPAATDECRRDSISVTRRRARVREMERTDRIKAQYTQQGDAGVLAVCPQGVFIEQHAFNPLCWRMTAKRWTRLPIHLRLFVSPPQKKSVFCVPVSHTPIFLWGRLLAYQVIIAVKCCSRWDGHLVAKPLRKGCPITFGAFSTA